MDRRGSIRAVSSPDAGRRKDATGHLRAFLNRVRALDGKKLAADQVQALAGTIDVVLRSP